MIAIKIIVPVLASLYIAWVSYVKGWSDSCDGTGNKTGQKDDMWHIVTRYFEYWPSLIVLPVGVFAGNFIDILYFMPVVIPLATSRLWFRWGVHENGKYKDWYGEDFSITGALIWHK